MEMVTTGRSTLQNRWIVWPLVKTKVRKTWMRSGCMNYWSRMRRWWVCWSWRRNRRRRYISHQTCPRYYQINSILRLIESVSLAKPRIGWVRYVERRSCIVSPKHSSTQAAGGVNVNGTARQWYMVITYNVYHEWRFIRSLTLNQCSSESRWIGSSGQSKNEGI